MANVVDTIEIDRPPAEVFAYLDQHERHKEWQDGIVSARIVTDGPIGVGTRVAEVRKVGGGEREITWEITTYDPPGRFAFHGVDGPLRPCGEITLEPLDGGTRTRLTIDFHFEAHGLGKMFAPMALREVRREMPKGHRKLKEILESEPAAAAPAQAAPAATAPEGGTETT